MDIETLIKEGTYHRNYRKKSFEASLNPAIAFALNHLAGLDEGDRILDPCCGTGTILIERQLLKLALCIGVDINPKYLEYAKENAQVAGLPVILNKVNKFAPSALKDLSRMREHSNELRDSSASPQNDIILLHGDITTKKFSDNYFTKIISNLPYGIHTGSREQNRKLYQFLAQSSEKWLKIGGKIILLTSAKKLLWNAFATQQNLRFISETPIQIGHFHPSIFIYQKI